MRDWRWIASCLAAALATVVVPVLGFAWGIHEGPGTLPNGQPDNAPWRASVILLALMPVGFLLACFYFAALSLALRKFGRLSLQWLLLANIPFCLLVASSFAWRSFESFGMRDAAISFTVFGSGALLCLTLGSVTWSLAERLVGRAPNAP